MSIFSNHVLHQLLLRSSVDTAGATGSLMVKGDNPHSRRYVSLEQGTEGQILTSNGPYNNPVWRGNILFEINTLEVNTIVAADFIPFYDVSESVSSKTTFANLEAALTHNNLISGTIANHDTTATGAQLTTLTDNSIANALHRHSELVASDGNPDPALSADADGNIQLPYNAQLLQFGTTQNYSAQWDGSDAVHTITVGGYIFNGGTLTASLNGGTGNDTPSFGANLVINGDFASDLSNWTIGDGGAEWVWDTGKARHVAGNVSTFFQGITVVNGETYQLEFVISNNTGSTFMVSLGTHPCVLVQAGNQKFYITFIANLTGVMNLTFTPTATFNGRIDDVILQQLTGTSTPIVVLKDTTDSTVFEVRGESSVDNVYIGTNAGQWNTQGYNNIAVGADALGFNTIGFDNTAIGGDTLGSNTIGYNNLAIGGNALANNLCGYGNIAVGGYALYNNMGSQNTAIGGWALYTNVTGNYNTAIGTHALRLNTIGKFNIGIGRTTAYSNTEGHYNTAVGTNALYSNTEGIGNVALGGNALHANTISGYSVAVGHYALYLATGEYNVGIGGWAGYNTSTGTHNIAIGRKALYDNTTGNYNIGIGYMAGGNLVAGAECNIFLGLNSGLGIVTGDYNVVIGNSIVGLAADLQNHVIIGDGEGHVRIVVDASGNHKYGDGGVTNYTQFSATGDQTFHGSAGLYPRTLEQDAKPAAGTGATQIDSGEMLIWIDTNDSNKVYTVYNYSGTVVAALLAL